MEKQLLSIATALVFLPLIGAMIAGFFGKVIGRRMTHTLTISLVGLSFLLACYLFKTVVLGNLPALDASLYTWAVSGDFQFKVAFLIDHLSVMMALVVTFVSLMVHIYTIGYMSEDPGYQRFFSYVSLFTFAMLSLVMADNFLLLFFGWEGVGLVSYLLIGFWFERETAVFGSLKAFLANRVADVGFILATAAVLVYAKNLNYLYVFSHLDLLTKTISFFPGTSISLITLICILLFIGAMGKSAQVPLHVWLPESMEGPTPISALIHAATMVTAGIYMVARMSPLFEQSSAALSLVLVIGATTCLFMGILAVFHHDIKRVIAYSTLSQLGYMTVALGVSAYPVAIFHLMTHAFFKALLFLGAGSVIVALHHEQDMRKMGGLCKRLPITYLTFLIGTIALSAIPPFAGFYSKDAIIEAVHLSHVPGVGYAYFCVMAGAFLTPLYSFRALFLTFHGETRLDAHLKDNVQESPWVILIPLIALAVPSMVAGGLLIYPMLYASPSLFGNSITILSQHNVLLAMSSEFYSAKRMAIHASHTLTFWLVMAGIATAWIFNLEYPQWAESLKRRFHRLYYIITKKYGFDDFNQIVFVHGARRLGDFFYRVSDLKFIDGLFVNGSGKMIRWVSERARKIQTGYLYHYAFAMVAGLAAFLIWFLVRA